MNGQEHYDKAEESAAEAHKPLARDGGQDTAAAWAAAASAITQTDPDRHEIPTPGDRPAGSAQTPVSGRRPAARALTPRGPVTR